MDVNEYKHMIANIIHSHYMDLIKKDNMIKNGDYLRGGGSLSLTSKYHAGKEYQPTYGVPMLHSDHRLVPQVNEKCVQGGKIKPMKIMKTIAHDIATPAIKRGTSKFVNAVVDKGVNSIINSMQN